MLRWFSSHRSSFGLSLSGACSTMKHSLPEFALFGLTRSMGCKIEVIFHFEEYSDSLPLSMPVCFVAARPAMICLTATLLAGQETTNILNTLGLKPGTFFSQRRSKPPTSATTFKISIMSSSMDLPAGHFQILTGLSRDNHLLATLASAFRYVSTIITKPPHKIIRLYNSLCFPCMYEDSVPFY